MEKRGGEKKKHYLKRASMEKKEDPSTREKGRDGNSR